MSQPENVETATEPTQETPQEPEPKPKPTETVDFWKQKAREQEKRAKENAEKALRFDEIEAASLSEQEKARKLAKDAEDRAAKAETEVMRWKIAARHGISDSDAELFLTGSDEETLTRQAERFKELNLTPGKGTHVPGVGNKPPAPPSLAEQITAAESSGDKQLVMSLKTQQLLEAARRQ